MNVMSFKRLAQSITAMRVMIRTDHIDIRLNAKVSGDLYNFVAQLPRSKEPEEISALEEFENEIRTLRSQASLKRRRAEEERDQTYRAPGIDGGTFKGDESAVVNNLRSSKAAVAKRVKTSPPPSGNFSAATGTSTAATAPAAARAQAGVRPPPIAMDAPPQQSYSTRTVRNQFNNPGY